jgi:hypothetical protein
VSSFPNPTSHPPGGSSSLDLLCKMRTYRLLLLQQQDVDMVGAKKLMAAQQVTAQRYVNTKICAVAQVRKLAQEGPCSSSCANGSSCANWASSYSKVKTGPSTSQPSVESNGYGTRDVTYCLEGQRIRYVCTWRNASSSQLASQGPAS